MANTRTLLAWIRTSVAVIGLGFVVARFGLFLEAVDAQRGRAVSAPRLSGPIGVGLVLVGVLLTLLSLRRFRQIERSIEAGLFHLNISVELITAGAIILTGLALGAYLVLTR
ncbi:MAG: YidH family protein [Candidatus Dormibacter sp.]|uniref:YidH family protein n=1 Tax=Candidatus Dormibacter sp. TaxID=2973982 RepID=UPI00267E4A59